MVDIEDQSFSVNAVLSRILTRSNQYLDSCPQPTYSPSTPAHCIHVELPEPPALLPALAAAGARPEVAQAMQAAYYERACEFREQALATISRACSKLARGPSTCSHTSDETIIAAFKQIYLKKLNTWISEGVTLLQEKGPSVLRCREDNESVPAKVPNTFNHQYVPLLEHFFEENPFPTHADKVFLAKKSNMTYRQIHVWFQNRRNRTKKALRKKPISEGASIPLDTLIRKMGKFAVPPTTKSDAPPGSQSTSDASPTEAYNVLDGVAPPHAFPTIYPPSCEYDPFPSVPIFVTSEWPRRPVLSSERPLQSVTDVDELTEMFSRLNVWGDSLSRPRRKARQVTCDGSAATSAITIKPSSAPHPACMRITTAMSTPHRITFQPIPIRAATPFLHHVFRSPSPDSPMTTLIPTLSHRRKIAPLPKRIPSGQPFNLDREISGSSMNSPSLTSSSRSSSLGSEASIQDNRFTSDWSSNSPSTATTPETSPSPLSHPT